MSRIVAIVQARMGSNRLPGKVLRPIVGRPVLWHIVNRLRAVSAIDEIAIATGDHPADDPIREFGKSCGIPCFSGSEEDVLDRFYHAALAREGDPVLRVTADCPLVDPETVSRVIDLHRASSRPADLTSVATGAGVATVGFAENRFPDGLDAEVIRVGALHRAWQESNLASDREHVTAYIWRRPGHFRIQHLTCTEGDFSELRWTLDHQDDFDMISRVYEALYDEARPFGMRDVLSFLATHPEVGGLNAHRLGDEGYSALWQEVADA